MYVCFTETQTMKFMNTLSEYKHVKIIELIRYAGQCCYVPKLFNFIFMF